LTLMLLGTTTMSSSARNRWGLILNDFLAIFEATT